MKQFKTLFIMGCAALLVISVLIIQAAIRPDTVDFRGTVIEVKDLDDGRLSIKAESSAGGEFMLTADEKSRLVDHAGETIAASDLIPGSMIDVEYRGGIFKKNKNGTVKRLVLQIDGNTNNLG
ncbi:MAG: hypothetical protein E7617_01450 [Ruminococcaceae bacterium]|nr:hypothetical protein [Oscillospiraceae bacterium]